MWVPCRKCDQLGNGVSDRIVRDISDITKMRGRSNKERRKRHTSHRMGANNSLPHFGLAHRGVEEVFCLPVRTEQSVSKCLSMRMLGSSPAGIAIGTLQKGPEKQACLSRKIENPMSIVLTIWCYSIMFALIVLVAIMTLWQEMIPTE